MLEISREIDKRLIELTKLNKKWFDKLGEYLKNELYDEGLDKSNLLMQVLK